MASFKLREMLLHGMCTMLEVVVVVVVVVGEGGSQALHIPLTQPGQVLNYN
jgi:hypothetical protein